MALVAKTVAGDATTTSAGDLGGQANAKPPASLPVAAF